MCDNNISKRPVNSSVIENYIVGKTGGQTLHWGMSELFRTACVSRQDYCFTRVFMQIKCFFILFFYFFILFFLYLWIHFKNFKKYFSEPLQKMSGTHYSSNFKFFFTFRENQQNRSEKLHFLILTVKILDKFSYSKH